MPWQMCLSDRKGKARLSFWYQLTPEEQKKIMMKNEESFKQVGGEEVVRCASVWSSEEWLSWGVEKYPNIEAVQKHANNLFNANWFEYIESKTSLGAEMPQPEVEG